MNKKYLEEIVSSNLTPKARIKGGSKDKFREQRNVNQFLQGFKGFSSQDVEDILEGTEGISDKKFEEFKDMIKHYKESKEKIDTDKDILLESKVEAMLKNLSKVNRNRMLSEVLGEIGEIL